MQLLDIGGRAYPYALAAATLSFTPMADRGALIRNILISNPSANDLWTVTVGGKEVMRFRVDTVGNQRVVFGPPATSSPGQGFFDFCRDQLGLDASIPVPQGITITVASVAGATADIVLREREVQIGDLNTGQLNHYQGNAYLLPVYGRLAAAVAAAGVISLDTQDAPAWVPNIVTGAAIPVGWMVEILALFLEGQGRNTFTGAANHASITQDLRMLFNGEQLFSRPVTAFPLQGIPNVGLAAAAGSANSVFGQRTAVYTPFALGMEDPDQVLDPVLTLRGGDSLTWQHEITGDVTGGADYSHAHQVAVCRVSRTS